MRKLVAILSLGMTFVVSSAAALTVRVAPGGTGTEGASWEDALGNLATAIDKVSAAGGGEVWVKSGAYYIASTLPLKSGVAVIGGFTGSEASAAAADGKTNVTLLYGDKNLDSYWKPNGTNNGYSETYRVLVDEGEGKVSLNAINPGLADNYWKYNGNVNDDTQTCFEDTAGSLTGCALRGLTIATFSYTSVKIAAGSEVSISACDFVADNQGFDAQQPILCAGFLDLSDCRFRGCRYGVQFTTASNVEGKMNLVADCLFEGCAGSGNNACVYNFSNKSLTVVSNCVFRCNFGDGTVPGVTMTTGMAEGSTLTDCLFESNRLASAAETFVSSAKPVTRCRFVGNSFVAEPATGGTRHSACLVMSGTYVICRDCYFAKNVCRGYRGPTDTKQHFWSSAFGLSSGIVSFLNCSFVDNESSSSVDAEGNHAGTFVIMAHDANQSVSLYNCIFKDSKISGGATYGEFVLAGGNSGYSGGGAGSPFSFVNCIFENENSGYKPFTANDNVTPCFANCYVRNLDTAATPKDEKSFLYGLTTSGDPLTADKPRVGANGAWAQGVAYDSPFTRTGRPIWICKSKVYCYLPEVDSANPWRAGNTKGGTSSVTGLTLESPAEPDAFGDPWYRGRVAYGPANPPSLGLMLLFR